MWYRTGIPFCETYVTWSLHFFYAFSLINTPITNKIKQHISKDIDENNILNEIGTKKLYNEPSLLAYEKNLILKNLN